MTIAWTAVEAAGAVAAGWLAHSIALLGFGLDSLIEFAAAFAVYRGLVREIQSGADTAREGAIVRFIGWTFLAVGGYIAFESVRDLVNHSTPSPSPFGVTLSAVALVVMATLGVAKRRIATAIGSRALMADGVETFKPRRGSRWRRNDVGHESGADFSCWPLVRTAAHSCPTPALWWQC